MSKDVSTAGAPAVSDHSALCLGGTLLGESPSVLTETIQRGGDALGVFPPLKNGLQQSSSTIPHRDYIYSTENQEDFPAPIRNSTVTCEPYYIVVACGCGHHTVKSGCMKKNCVTCKDYTSHHRAKETFKRFVPLLWRDEEFLAKDGFRHLNNKVIYTVFTMPPELRPKYVDKKKCRLLRSKLWKLLESFGASFGCEVTHPIGDKNPDLFSPHFNFIWRQRETFKPFINVAKLNEGWAKILKTNLAVDCWTEYEDKIENIRHICNYVCRTFPQYAEWSGYIRWYGNYPDVKDEGEVCQKCHEKIIAIGTANIFSLDGYLSEFQKSGVDPPKYFDAEEFTLFGQKKHLLPGEEICQ